MAVLAVLNAIMYHATGHLNEWICYWPVANWFGCWVAASYFQIHRWAWGSPTSGG